MSILVATDFSENSEPAILQAARLAKAHDEQLVLVHCLETAVDDTPWRHLLEMPQAMRGQFWKAAVSRLEEVYESTVPAEQRPSRVDFRVELKYAEDGILGLLDEEDFSMVVMGATGLSRVANFFLGSTAEEIVRRSDVPVLVVRDDAPAGPYDKIVAPVDLTDCSRHSLEQAAAIAREDDAELLIVHAYVLPVTETTFLPSQMPPETIAAYEQQRERELQKFVDSAKLAGVEHRSFLEVGAAHNVISDIVEEEEAPLVVMGTHGRRGFQRLFLGSTATKVLRRMPASIMTVRTPAGDEETDESND